MSHPSNNQSDPVILSGHTSTIRAIAFSPSDQLIASSASDKTIRLWSVDSGVNIATLELGDSTFCLAFSPDGGSLASSTGATISLRDVETRAETAILEGHSNSSNSVAFSPDGARLASGSFDRTIRLWDTRSRGAISVLKGHSNTVYSVAFSPDGKMLASGSLDSTIQLWDVSSGTSLATLKDHSREVTSVMFSPNGEFFASGSYDSTIRFWDVATSTSIATLEGNSQSVLSIALSSNGKDLVSGSADGTVRLWDITSEAQISTFHDPDPVLVTSVALSPDGSRLAAGGFNFALRLWDVPQRHAPVDSHTQLDTAMDILLSDTTEDQDDEDTIFDSIPPQNSLNGVVSLANRNRIGSGGFGELFLGNHKDRGQVALKRPHKMFDKASFRRFLREVDLWCSVSNRYVLPCLGICKIETEIYVVSPFVKNGDLMSCLTKGMNLNRIKLLYEIAEALAHLHHRGIVHGDVKAQNVLVSEDGSALLCDFGLAKLFDTMVTSTETKGSGSIRWMAPELFKDGSRAMPTDVYSFGITIAEILSGQPPFHEIPDNIKVMVHVLLEDGRPATHPLHSPEGRSYSALWEIAQACWAKDTKDRPSMAQVLGMLFPLTREKN